MKTSAIEEIECIQRYFRWDKSKLSPATPEERERAIIAAERLREFAHSTGKANELVMRSDWYERSQGR